MFEGASPGLVGGVGYAFGAPTVEVQQLTREFLDMIQMTETVAEITANFKERVFLVP